MEVVVLGVLAALVVGGASLAWVRSRPLPVSLAEPPADPGGVVEPPDASSAATMWIHVVGAVRRPGVYELAVGARAVDAVEAAGGLGPNADPLAVNLARVLTDGEQLIVPRRTPASQSAGASGAAAASAETSKININTADQAALESLPGIGPALASRIIQYREQNGPFSSISELVNVSGIGDKTLANLEPYITI